MDTMQDADVQSDEFEVAKWYWWIAIVGGLTLLAFQGLHDGFYAWWVSNVHGLPSQEFMMWLLIAALPIHVFEAVYVFRLSKRLGYNGSASSWMIQTFILGYPSTSLILRRARQAGV